MFGTTSCDFLGHRIGARYITPQEAKISAVANFCCPTTKKDVRSFLGLAEYYRRYIRNFSGIAAPLSDLTVAIAPDKVEWTPSCQQALKVLTSSPVLSPPDYDLPFVLLTDASDRGIGAVLTQPVDTDEKPIAYFSRKLHTREQKYSATEKEGLAVVAACRHFLPYLLGHHFTVVTDHRALTFLHGKDPTSSRLARWFDALKSSSDLGLLTQMPTVSLANLGLNLKTCGHLARPASKDRPDKTATKEGHMEHWTHQTYHTQCTHLRMFLLLIDDR